MTGPSARPDPAGKTAVRARLRERRAAQPRPDRDAASERIRARLASLPELTDARRVFAYLATDEEVDLDPLIAALLATGVEVAAPAIVGPGDMHAARLTGLAAVTTAQLGIRTPAPRELVTGPFDVALTPGVGFSERGARIGYGAGYYDRWFEANPGVRRVAVAFELQLTDAIPTESHDVPMHRVVTEARVIDI